MTADYSSRPKVLRRTDAEADGRAAPKPKSWRPSRSPRFAGRRSRTGGARRRGYAIIGIFILLLGAILYVARSLIAPIVAAAMIGVMFGPLAARAAR